MVPRPNLDGNFIGDREFDSNVFYFLIIIKAYSIFVCTHFIWFFLSLSPRLVMSGKVEAPFGPKFSRIHLSNSQSMLLPIMGFEYINGLPPIHYGPFRTKVGIMVHLVVSDLLIYPFSSRKPIHT